MYKKKYYNEVSSFLLINIKLIDQQKKTRNQNKTQTLQKIAVFSILT